MIKTLFIAMMCMSINSLAIAQDINSGAIKDKLLLKILIEEKLLKPYETDKVIISIAMLEGKKNNKYMQRVETQYQEHLNEQETIKNFEANILTTKSSKSEQDKDKEIAYLVKNNSKLVEVVKTSIEKSNKQEEKINMLELRISQLEREQMKTTVSKNIPTPEVAPGDVVKNQKKPLPKPLTTPTESWSKIQ